MYGRKDKTSSVTIFGNTFLAICIIETSLNDVSHPFNATATDPNLLITGN